MLKVVRKDHYAVLGVRRDATADEIKKRYRELAKGVHPDCLGPDITEEARKDTNKLFGEYSLSYEHLSDSAVRLQIDEWLSLTFEAPESTDAAPVVVPPAGQYLLNGIWCWVEFRRSPSGLLLKAIVTIQLADLFKVAELGPLPHDAWLEEIRVVDQKGDEVGRGYFLLSLRYDVRLMQAEARRNEARRVWRGQLKELERQMNELQDQRRPVGHLQELWVKARRYAESGRQSLRQAEQHDTVVRAIREVEKEIERIKSQDAAALLLDDLLNRRIGHRDLDYNQRLLEKLSIYALRSGGEYVAPTAKEVREHYQRCLAGLTTHDQVYQANLRLADDEPTILELVAEGALELAPDTIEAPGNRGLKRYEVKYAYAKVDDEMVPAGVIVVTEAVYDRHGWKYGKASQFPALPYGILLLIRVRVRAQDNEALTAPLPDDKSLQNEVARRRARLLNPKETEPELPASLFLTTWDFSSPWWA